MFGKKAILPQYQKWIISVHWGLPADLVNVEIGVDDWGQARGKGVQRSHQLQPKQELVLQLIQFMPRIWYGDNEFTVYTTPTEETAF